MVHVDMSPDHKTLYCQYSMRRIEQAANSCVQADEITPGKGLREYLEAKVEPEPKHIC
jgi:hypothetical protein